MTADLPLARGAHGGGGDPFDLARFVAAQDGVYDVALRELRAGRKRTHWMWFVFPQLAGLGTSPTSRRYALRSAAEARAYLEHPVLGPRLRACADALLALEGRTAADVFGHPDDLKLHSCATLFRHVAGAGSVFDGVLARYFSGRADPRTLDLLSNGMTR